MANLVKYCRESNNDTDHRQARIFRAYLIAILLNGDTSDVRFYNANGLCFRIASFA
jgi:hypothetical protein